MGENGFRSSNNRSLLVFCLPVTAFVSASMPTRLAVLRTSWRRLQPAGLLSSVAAVRAASELSAAGA